MKGTGILLLASLPIARCGLALLRMVEKWRFAPATTRSVSLLSVEPAQVFRNRSRDALFEILNFRG